MEWIKANKIISELIKREDKLLTFKSNNMNFTGWYNPDKNYFEDVLSGTFPIDDVYILSESTPTVPGSVDIVEALRKGNPYRTGACKKFTYELDNAAIWDLSASTLKEILTTHTDKEETK